MQVCGRRKEVSESAEKGSGDTVVGGKAAGGLDDEHSRPGNAGASDLSGRKKLCGGPTLGR